ncbi:MAG TPA: response regulator transcription factor [Coriobacteriia bacterium]|nr:response regulator transcription factor [Coriobacteriia bacterium]
MARILVAEYVDICARGLAEVLAGHQLTFAGEHIERKNLDLAIVSTSTPTLEHWPEIAKSVSGVPVIFVTQDHEWFALKSMLDGADVRGIVHMQAPAPEIVAAVDTVLRGEGYFAMSCRACASKVRRSWLDELGATRREIEVLDRVLRGRTNAAIAREIGCSERTVKFHVSNLLRKAEVRTRRELRDAVDRLNQRLGLVGIPIT